MKARGALFRLSIAAVTVLALAGTVHALRPEPDVSQSLYLFGTLVEVEIHGVDEAKAKAAIARVDQHLQHIHKDWHAWRPGTLEGLNAAFAAGESISVDPTLAKVLERGRDLACASDGLFDPGIGALIEAWGFHADTLPEGDPPSEDTIAALIAPHPTMLDVTIDGTTIRAANPAVQLDLGAYAKGAALDLAEDDLRAAGITDAVLNAGGGVQVMGSHGARPWRVAIRDPFAWGVVAALELAPGEALHTSGNYERYLEAGGLRFSHILDPRTGRPVTDIVSVSVLAENGALADAAATALSVAGAQDWPRIAAQMGVENVLMITGQGEIFATPSMRARLDPVGGDFPAPVTLVDLPASPRPRCN
ncbi:thiamine biosynthesis lipoprotein [Rhodobacter aestuarii]|uniref:FAD:protein FMN transferase n=1 Tax=Rhodobacter aestuarii TaxID=453582 RepID=A0A1N7J948_9RHOB|nr:FAD:protein FMN transferase [Rhodobacter aestuarii]PTV97058.1 thiamine biosynthesis lipoprotein [Rhodobacter aestuarii]SIS45746.1 thiamine biosynthesis lipoprotein [Rhodobacter aestuarii]